MSDDVGQTVIDTGNDVPADTQSVQTESAPSWMWDDNTPGSGDRPEYLPEKFKSVADAAKSYLQLEKKLGSAPQEYNFDVAKDWLDPNFGGLKDAAEFAKSKHVPQEVFDKILGAASDYIKDMTTISDSDKARLGDNAEERLNTLDGWMRNNFSENAYNALTDNLDNADAIFALEEVRAKMLESNTTVPGSSEASTPEYTYQQVQEELTQNMDKYRNDSQYRAEIQSKLARVASKSGFMDK